MTENKNFCVSSLYDLLKNDNINVRWEGSNIHLKRPGGLSDLHKIAFRNFKGELQPFTNIELPKLKADVLLISDGLKEINITSDDTYDLPGKIKYENTKINKIMTIDKAWTYDDDSENGVIYDNIKELFDLTNITLNDYFTRVGLYDNIDLTDLTTWAPLEKFYNIQNELDPTFSPLIVDSEKNIYYYDSSETVIKSFKLSNVDYFKGYPDFNGKNKDLIVGFSNNDNYYVMKIYYGVAPNLTLIYQQRFPYSSNRFAFNGAGPGGGKYYNNYSIMNPTRRSDANKFPVIICPYISISEETFRLYLFGIIDESHVSQTYIDLRDPTLSYLEDLQLLITNNELKEIILIDWSYTKSNNFALEAFLKVEHEENTYYFTMEGRVVEISYSANNFSVLSGYTPTYRYSDYNPNSVEMFERFGIGGAFDGQLTLWHDWASASSYMRYTVPGLGWIELSNSPENSKFERELCYISNIVNGYYEDSSHVLGYFMKEGTNEHFYKAVEFNRYGPGSAKLYETVDGQYYDIDKHYGQFLNGGPILFYNCETLTSETTPNAVRISTMIKSDVMCTALDNSDNTVYLSPRNGDYMCFPYGFNPFILTTFENTGERLDGSAYIPEIYFNGFGANILLRIHTEPYYFELITERKFITNTTDYNMVGTLTDLIYRASNNKVLKMLEYLILLRYNNNNVIMRCSNFPNNDGVIFNINEESKINFKTMITDNTQQEIIITLEGNDGTPITYELLKEIYAHVCVSVDWIQ